MLGVGEEGVGGATVALDAVEELRQTGLPLAGFFHVDQLRHLRARKTVLVLQSRDVLARSHPSVSLAVEPHEDVALREVGAVQVARRMRARAELEHHGSEVELLDGRTHRASLDREFAERRTHEHAQALVGSTDRRIGGAHAMKSVPRGIRV